MLDNKPQSQIPSNVDSPNGNNSSQHINQGMDANECLQKIIAANDLEKLGELDQALALYQEVLALDKEGTYAAIAQQAVENLEKSTVSVSQMPVEEEKSEMEASEMETSQVAKSSIPLHQRLLQKFYDLPIQTKQFSALFTSEFISVLGLVGIGSFLIIAGGQSQLLNQAKSELTVTEVNYNAKINQMGFGFRGQADNVAIVKAAQIYNNGKSLTPELREEVKTILQNEIKAREIEYATLVGKDRRIIVNANADRQGEEFDPKGLVSSVFENPWQIKTSEIVSWSELEKEGAPLPEGFSYQDGLIRYTMTPVKDPVTQSVVGVLVSGDIVNQKLPIVENTLKAFDHGYSAVYLSEPDGTFALTTSIEKESQDKLGETKYNQPLPNDDLLAAAIANPGKTITKRLNIDGQFCSPIPLPLMPKCYSMAAKAIPNFVNEPVAILVRGTSESNLEQLIWKSLGLQGVVVILVLVVNIGLASLLAQAVVKPVKQLRQMAEDFSAGNREVRTEAIAADEIGELTTSFNEMADSIVASEADLAEQSQQQEAEAQRQRQAKEQLQQGVTKLLLEIEAAQQGDLTVNAEVTEGIVGSIADAFNATIRKLRQLVLQVKTLSEQVNELAQGGETSVRQLSDAALNQTSEINEAEKTAADMNISIQQVADSATEAASIAHLALTEAQKGDVTMDETVNSIENIRATVAGNAKKVKQLAESSQEISQIVAIISNISEKTNLLAFNASVEAARAGEHGQGFRVVADEVRRLADRVTEATKEIQQLVNTIQQDTSTVLHTMEASTTEVVSGTKLVRKTKDILQGLASTSEKIDLYLQIISQGTNTQKDASQQVNQRMTKVASIAQENSTGAEEVVKSLQVLVEGSEELQLSVSQFRV